MTQTFSRGDLMFCTRCGADAATAAMLASASDVSFDDVPAVVLTLLSTVFGTVRSVFERDLAPEDGQAVCGQLVVMCVGYLKAVT